jgi:transposase
VEQDEPKTEVFAPADAPTEWETARPRYFGVTPHGLAAVLAAFAFGAGIVVLSAGDLAVGVLLLVAALLLAALWAEHARRRRDTAFDRIGAAAVDHTRALAGFTGSSVRAWTAAGRETTRLRLAANRLARRRSALQYALGGATYAGDEAEAARLHGELQAVDRQIAACIARANEVVEQMRRTTARERLAVAPTEVKPPDTAPPAP